MTGQAEGAALRPSPGVPDFEALIAGLTAAEKHQTPPVRGIYLAGPMTGIEGWNHAAFAATAQLLRGDIVWWGGRPTVHSPAELFEGDVERPREHYMRAGLDLLVGASSAQPFRPRPTDVVLLPGWEASRGAVVEVLVAQELELRVWRPDGSLLPAVRWEALSVQWFGEYAGLAGQVLMWPTPEEMKRCVSDFLDDSDPYKALAEQYGAVPVKGCGASYSISSAPLTARDVRDLPVEGDGDSTLHVTPRVASLPRSVGQAGCSGHHAELVRLGQQVQAAGRGIEGAALLGDTAAASSAAEGLDELAALVIDATLVEGCR